MHQTINNLISINKQLDLAKCNSNIIAVSKTFTLPSIIPLIDYGHIHFGENKVQEAIHKWTDIKTKNKKLKLHMIGKLQTNKVKFVIPLFDYIHSLDNLKLAEKIFLEQKKINKYLKIFIQVNIGNEKQKNGVNIGDVNNFYNECISKFNLDIIGLMCIPPVNGDKEMYYKSIKNLNDSLGLSHLSMGMSDDYMDAIKFGSTYLRIGSNIFGNRA